MDWKPYIQSIAKVASRKVGSLYRAPYFLTPESILYMYKSTIRPCIEYCSRIWGGAPRSHGLDLLHRVQNRVVSFVGSGLAAGLQALSHKRDVAGLPNVSLLETLAFLSRCIVIQLILLCAGLCFINQAFHQITAFKGRENKFLLLQ